MRQPLAASRRHRHQIAGLIRLVVIKHPAIGTLSPSPSSIHTILAAPSFFLLLPGKGKTLGDSVDKGMSLMAGVGEPIVMGVCSSGARSNIFTDKSGRVTRA